MSKTKPCPLCRALGKDTKGDNLYIYEDGSGFCHARGHYVSKEEVQSLDMELSVNIDRNNKKTFVGEYLNILERGISKKTCENVGILQNNIEYAFLYNNGVKIRNKTDKKFYWLEGNSTENNMFGLGSAKDLTKPIIITEGEFDTAACYEIGYQACSLRSGAGDVIKSLMFNIDDLSEYKEVWIAFDMDSAGQEAVNKATILLNKHNIKNKIINLQYKDMVFKDANEALNFYFPDKKSALENILDFYSKDNDKSVGLVFGNELDFNLLQTEIIKSIPIPFPKLYLSLGGFDYGCLYLILAGVGIGKSTLLNELSYYYFSNNYKIANLFYEESEKVTPLRYIALENNIPVGLLRRDRTLLSSEQWENSRKSINKDTVCFLNKEAIKNSESLFKNIEYLVEKKGFDIIIIDHISYIIGRSGVSKNGERRDIDELIYKLQDLTHKLGCIIICVSHITESNGTKGWDEGEIPSLYSGRGSKVLAQVPDGIIGLARDMKNEYKQAIMTTYCLKNRWGNKLGKMDSLVFHENTGRLELFNYE